MLLELDAIFSLESDVEADSMLGDIRSLQESERVSSVASADSKERRRAHRSEDDDVEGPSLSIFRHQPLLRDTSDLGLDEVDVIAMEGLEPVEVERRALAAERVIGAKQLEVLRRSFGGQVLE